MSAHELYLKGVEAYLANDHQGLQSFLDHSTPSQSEKNLIRARLHARSGEYDAAENLLRSMTPETHLLRGDRHFVMANVLSHNSRWQECLIHAHQSLGYYHEAGHKRGIFLANYNLSVYYNRLGLDDVSLHYINESEKNINNDSNASLVHRAKACHFARLLDFKKAIQSLENALDLKESLDEVDRAALFSVAADLYFRSGLEELSLKFIESLSRSRVIRDKARVRFDLTVLRSMVNGSTLLIDSAMPDVVRENEEYRLRWEVVENLQDGDLTVATKKWNRLCELFPQRFAPEFKCLHSSDEKLIFIVAIRKLMQKSEVVSAEPLSGKSRKLFETMKNAPIPLRKEELIERVWEVPYDPSMDSRFYKLLERLRKGSQLNIETVNHTYRLIS